jgi:hypothetical protein
VDAKGDIRATSDVRADGAFRTSGTVYISGSETYHPGNDTMLALRDREETITAGWSFDAGSVQTFEDPLEVGAGLRVRGAGRLDGRHDQDHQRQQSPHCASRVRMVKH